MIAEIIAIGDEITTGQRLDTNSQWLAERLTELGAEVVYHTTVADDLAANIVVFSVATQRADVVVATGGLGPTDDDLTREAIAAMLNTELVLDELSLAYIESLFVNRGRSMPEKNKRQAMFPRGTQPIANPHGTAPGIFAIVPRESPGMPIGKCRLFALPGVPAEMKPMFTEGVVPNLTGSSVKRVLRHRRIHCFGLGESHVEAKLPDLIKRGREPRVGITASGATITLRITAAGENAEACQRAMQPTVDIIYAALGNLIFGEECDELHSVLLAQLASRNETIATVEVASCGLMAEWLRGDTANAQQFRGGLILPDSNETPAVELARQTREQFGATYGLAVGGILHESDIGRATAPAFAVAIVTRDSEIIDYFSSASHPSLQATRNAKIGLNTLRLALVRGTL